MTKHYNTLGVPQTATKEQIKKAYRKLSLIYHPDRPNGSHEKFLEIKTAYEELMDIKPEKVHDQYEHRTKPYVHFNSTYFDSVGNYLIDVSFRNILFAETMSSSSWTYHWELYGLTDGKLMISKDFLRKCGYKFTIFFEPLIGHTEIRGFEIPDPRSKFEKFVDGIKNFF